MFFQLMLYDFITRLTFKGLIKLVIALIILAYYTAYNLIERRHPGIHKAQLMAMYNKYAAIFRPYETLFLSVSIAVIVLFFCYIAYCYWNNRKKDVQLDIQDDEPIQEKESSSDNYKDRELLFLKEQIQLIQQRIEAIERG